MRNFRKLITVPVTVISVLFLVGCDSEDSTTNEVVQGTEMAVIAAVGSLWDSSSISVAESLNAEDIVNGYAATDQSDIAVATYGDHFYRIGRYGQDNITKYSFDNPGAPLWQFSVNEAGEQSNPYDLLFVSEQKAYVIRYGASSIWIVNPSVSASEEDSFKIGEIDLSGYDTDGVPNMSAAVLVDGVLYVTLQAMDPSFSPGQAYLVAIDTSTNQQIDLSEDGGLEGIPLVVKNPEDLDYVDGTLYVTGVGRYGYPQYGIAAEYTGGIEKISLEDFSTTVILDDGDDDSHPYGNISEMEVISSNKAIFKGYTDQDDITLYQLDLTSNTVSDVVFAGLVNVEIRGMKLDSNGRLWAGLVLDQGPSIKVIDVDTQEVLSELPMTQNPTQIVFGNRNK